MINIFSLNNVVEALFNGIYSGREINAMQPFAFHSSLSGGEFTYPPDTENVIYVGYAHWDGTVDFVVQDVSLQITTNNALTPVVFERVIPGDPTTTPFQFIGYRIVAPGRDVTPDSNTSFLVSLEGGSFLVQNDFGGFILSSD